MNQVALADQLQIWGLENEIIVFTDGSLGFALEIKAIDVSCWSDEVTESYDEKLRQFLNGLPANIDIQFVQDIKKYFDEELKSSQKLLKPNTSELQKSLSDQRIEKFISLNNDGLLPKQNIKIFVRKPMSQSLIDKPKLFSKSTLFPKMSEERFVSEISKMRRIKDDMISSLNLLGVFPQEMKSDDILEELYRFWNPSRPIDKAQSSYDPEDLRSSIVYTDAVIGIEGISLGEYHYKIVSLKSLPSHTFASMSHTLSDLPFNSRLCMSIHSPNQQREIDALQLQRRIAFALVHGKTEGVSDLESNAKLEDLEDLLSDMIASGEKVFHISLQIVLKSKIESELEEMVSQTLLALQTMSGAEGMTESVACFDVFSQIAPPNCRTKERRKRIKTSNLSNILPIYGSWRGHKDPRVLLRSRSGTLIHFDPFSSELTNPNQIISGGSGSGKSFLTNLLLMQILKEDPKVFIVDIGGSYKKSCSDLGGQYVPLGLNDGISINPFDLSPNEYEPSNQKIKLLLALVEKMVKEDEKSGLGKFERTEIEKSILKVYDENSVPRLSHLKNILIRHELAEIKKVGYILDSWCGDTPYGKFLDRESNIELHRPIVCMDLKGLEPYPDLQSACLLIITDLISREIEKNKTEMKIVVFDECWQLLEDEKGEGAALVGNLFRTCRKYFTSCIAISQNLDDFARSKAANAIMSNASTKWLLRQKGADQKRLKEVLQLNENELSLISSLHQEKGFYSEAFLICEDHKSVVVVESTPYEYWLATTDPKDISILEKTKSENPQLDQIQLIDNLACRYPNGVSV